MERAGERRFSRASADKLPRPPVPADGGSFDYHRVNVQFERRDLESLLNRLERIMRTRNECPQIGAGEFHVVETDQPEMVFAHACTDGD